MKTNKYIRIQVCNIVLICAMISGISNCFASDVTSAEIFGSIKNRENVIKSDTYKTATFSLLTQDLKSDPNHGHLLRDCSLVWKKDDTRMKIVYNYRHDPIYISPDSKGSQPINYDKDKRRIVWRKVETYIISTSEKIEMLDKLQSMCVSPNGDIEKFPGVFTAKHIFREGSNLSGDGHFKYFLLAAGLSFSNYIDVNSIDIIKMPNGNSMEINSSGIFRVNTKGRWKLTVDSNEGYFVREASFTMEGLDKPSLELSTSNVIKKDGLEYARRGRIVFNNEPRDYRDYEDIDICVKDNQELRQEIEQQLEEPLPVGSQIIDFAGGKPTVTTIK